MHSTRIAAFLLGVWISCCVFMDLLALENLRLAGGVVRQDAGGYVPLVSAILVAVAVDGGQRNQQLFPRRPQGLGWSRCCEIFRNFRRSWTETGTFPFTFAETGSET